MQYFVTGGSGFIGTRLIRHLMDTGHRVAATGTATAHPHIGDDRLRWYSADTTLPGDWQEAVAGADVVVNLAGRTIFKRWSKDYRRQIVDSRILTTHNVVTALDPDRPAVMVSASAVGVYGDAGETELTEKSPAASDFLGRLAVDWEAAATQAESRGARVAVARLGIVLGRDGGALARMLPAFRAFVGGPIAGGRQWFPWVHVADVVEGLVHLAETRDLSGPYNFCAPQPVRNRDLARQLGRALGRPAFFNTPAAALRLALGEAAAPLTASLKAYPVRLRESGFRFRFPDLESALADLIV